jgi:hypothetical protein
MSVSLELSWPTGVVALLDTDGAGDDTSEIEDKDESEEDSFAVIPFGIEVGSVVGANGGSGGVGGSGSEGS